MVNIINFIMWFNKKLFKYTLKKLNLIEANERPLYKGKINLEGKKNL